MKSRMILLTLLIVFLITPISCSPVPSTDQVFVVDTSSDIRDPWTLLVVGKTSKGSLYRLAEPNDEKDPRVKVELNISHIPQKVGLLTKTHGKIFPHPEDGVKYRVEQLDKEIRDYELAIQKLRQQGVVDEIVTAVENRTIVLGMTKELVRLSWGEPDNWKRSVEKTSTYDTWLYKNRFALLYFHNGILASFEEGTIYPSDNVRTQLR